MLVLCATKINFQICYGDCVVMLWGIAKQVKRGLPNIREWICWHYLIVKLPLCNGIFNKIWYAVLSTLASYHWNNINNSVNVKFAILKKSYFQDERQQQLTTKVWMQLVSTFSLFFQYRIFASYFDFYSYDYVQYLIRLYRAHIVSTGSTVF